MIRIRSVIELHELCNGCVETEDDERLLEVDNYSGDDNHIVLGITKTSGDLEDGQYFWAISKDDAVTMAKSILSMCE